MTARHENLKDIKDEQFRRLTGVKRHTFNRMLEILQEAFQRKMALERCRIETILLNRHCEAVRPRQSMDCFTSFAMTKLIISNRFRSRGTTSPIISGRHVAVGARIYSRISNLFSYRNELWSQ